MAQIGSLASHGLSHWIQGRWFENVATLVSLLGHMATYVFQPLIFTGTKIAMPTYLASWMLNVSAGTWSQ